MSRATAATPGGSYSPVVKPSYWHFAQNFSCFVRMLPYTEQSAVYNAVNFNNNFGSYTNVTIAGVRLATLTCPSDAANTPVLLRNSSSPSGTVPGWNFGANYSPDQPPDSVYLQAYSSYAGNQGTWPIDWQQSTLTSTTTNGPGQFASMNGVIYGDSSVAISRDHRRHEQYLPVRRACPDQPPRSTTRATLCRTGRGTPGRNYDTLFAAWYPPNVGIGGGNAGSATSIVSGGYYPNTVSSQHPGGANMAFRRRLGPLRQEHNQHLDLPRDRR